MKPLEGRCHPLGEVRDWSVNKLEVLHDYVSHPTVSVEKVQDLENAWCPAAVKLYTFVDVFLRLGLRVQGLVVIEFNEITLGGHATSIVFVPPVLTLVFCASVDDGGLKDG